MTLIEVLVVLALVAAVAAVAVGAVRGGLDEPASTVPDPALVDPATDAPLRGSDLIDVRFALALRGYRMDQVDEALDRAADAIEARDEQIRRLGEQLTQARDDGVSRPEGSVAPEPVGAEAPEPVGAEAPEPVGAEAPEPVGDGRQPS